MNGIVRALGRLVPRTLRNWLRSPRATLRWLADEARFRSGPVAVEMRAGWRVHCHPAAYRLAYGAHLADPEQRDELDAFIASCRPGMVLYDLGAHFGLFSLAALHYGGPAAHAVAVEPSAFACRMLGIEAAANAVTGRMTVVRAAAGDRPGHMPMVAVGVIAAGYYSAAIEGKGAREMEDVRVVTVDQLARETGAWPTHLKIDVEGAEAAALAGAREAMTRRPTIALELHTAMVRDRGGDPAAALRVLHEAKYRLMDLKGNAIDQRAALAPALVRVVAVPA